MPELAEVEHSRRVWDAGVGQRVLEAIVQKPKDRVLRGVDVPHLRAALAGKKLVSSAANGKQMCFRFGRDVWLGLHLGMRGALAVRGPKEPLAKHDLLVLRQAKRALVFTDLRHFGRVRFHQGKDAPAWWTDLPPALASDEFTRELLEQFFARRSKRALKPLLLEQKRFPGVGNWMADEILWRARLQPERTGSSLSPAEMGALYKSVRHVARESVRTVDADWEYPKTWLFAHRWEDGGSCPRCDAKLQRAVIGGRKTCWCPRCQPDT